jgi:KaiC/GvpD/RAD55 family RecA-like ATPase
MAKKKVIKKATKKTSLKKRSVKKNAIKKKITKKNSSKKNTKKPTNKTHKKPTKKERIPTGMPGLDRLISGGFITKSINLVEGGNGSGKTIFAMQYLIEGLKKGEAVLYVTFEEKKENFYENMKKLGWDLEKAEKSNKFTFLEYSPEKIKMMLDEGGGSIESLVLRHKVKRLVIDSITSFNLLFDTELEKRTANMSLFDIIRKWECTTLLTVQHDPIQNEEENVSLLEFETDGTILLYFKKVKNKRQRFIEIVKMRGTNHSTDVHTLKIEKGIKIGGSEKSSSSKKKNITKKKKTITKKKKSKTHKKVKKKPKTNKKVTKK